MTDAQTWTFIIGALGVIAALLGITMNAVLGQVRSGFKVMDARFDTLESRLDGTDKRIDRLDADVQAITVRLMGNPN